ncbi:MAG: tetratricopeptide repeat protein [Bdellovibrionales bacterium]|nr:tetratricopeptide repeat protein [Bdellovibrionales bacterium]
MSEEIDHEDLLNEAREHFQVGELKKAEPLINQLILGGFKSAEVFHMLGTLLYDQGKFSKAIRSFRRALELDPSFTDASIGLSIILNDLGRYDEGKKVFEEAQLMLAHNKAKDDPYMNEKLALKHDELGELYAQFKRVPEAILQYESALELSARKPELTMKIVDCHMKLDDSDTAIDRIQSLLEEYPKYVGAKNRLANIYYQLGRIPDAIEVWEEVLRIDENNTEAKRQLAKVENIEVMPSDELTL